MTAVLMPTKDATIVTTPGLDPLPVETLRRAAPAIFATAAHESASARYGFASTLQVLTALEKHGYVPVEVRAYYRRDADRRKYTKHMLRLRRAGSLAKLKLVGNTVPQIIFLNSHDRSSKLSMFGGMWRQACANGLLVSSGSYVEALEVRHTNRIIEDLMANVDRIAADVAKVTTHIEDMMHVRLTDRQAMAFARNALDLRDGNGAGRGAVDPAALLVARRTEDAPNDVWHVYNRVQENMTKGGVASVTALGRNTHTRPVVSMNADMNINAGLWELAMAAIVKAKG